MFLLLVVSRGMDFLSTWVATPNMVLEGNPIAKKLGWKWGIPLNVVLCFGFAFWPLPAIVISTTSVLVASRNFQSAWLMRSLGEHLYREWHVERVQQTSITLYLFCLVGQTALTALVGLGLYLIARRMRSNVRDLEGALNTLAARSNFTGRAITADFAQETLRDLLRNLAHEVKNPLNAMTIHLELLRERLGASGEGVQENLEVIGSEIKRLDRAVQGFLKDAFAFGHFLFQSFQDIFNH